MGNINCKTEYNEKLLPIKVHEINIGENKMSKNYAQFLIGDRPIGIFKPDTEEIPEGVNKEEYNNTLANAYLFGII